MTPDDREFLIEKLKEMLIADYNQEVTNGAITRSITRGRNKTAPLSREESRAKPERKLPNGTNSSPAR